MTMQSSGANQNTRPVVRSMPTKDASVASNAPRAAEDLGSRWNQQFMREGAVMAVNISDFVWGDSDDPMFWIGMINYFLTL